MKLVYRLLIFSLALVAILVALVMLIVNVRLRERMISDRSGELRREALLVAAQWAAGDSPQNAAMRASTILGARVTLIDTSGIIVGDAATGGLEARGIGVKAVRPEVAQARNGKLGVSVERHRGGSAQELYVAVNSPKGVARVGVEMSALAPELEQARQDVATAGALALISAGLFAVLFARYVSKPVIQLRDMARSLGRREFEGHPVIEAPGEVGDLAESLTHLSARLQALENLRRDFIVNISHELSSPLTIVNGFASTLARHDPPAESRKQFARAILSNTHRMQRVIENMLDLSRIESGGWIPRIERVNLREMITDIFDAIGPAAEAKNVELRREVDDRYTVIRADPTWVRQIIGNLCENALRHTAHGEIVALVSGNNEGTWLRIRDTGEGIAPSDVPRIFERRFRADQGRALASGGSGLGLTIVKHMAEAHGGTVSADSIVGTGTTISVYFPSVLPQHKVLTPPTNRRVELDHPRPVV